MTIKEQKATRLRTLEEWFKGNIHAFDDITASDIVYHAPPQPDVLGKEAYKKYMAAVTNAFSGVRFTPQRYMNDG
jgi:CO/xanthine dehydrogenase FAD-binding subunit